MGEGLTVGTPSQDQERETLSNTSLEHISFMVYASVASGGSSTVLMTCITPRHVLMSGMMM